MGPAVPRQREVLEPTGNWIRHN